MINAESTHSEEWRPVVGHEGRYDVSNTGRVRSLRTINQYVDKEREVPLVLTPHANDDGYLKVHLSGRSAYIHSIVLCAFVGPRPFGHESGHLNGLRSDNRIENLAWVTKSQNENHKRKHGTHRTKVTPEQVVAIRVDRADGLSWRKLAAKYGISPRNVGFICQRKTWGHVS